MSEAKAKSAGLMHLNNVRTSHFYGHEPYTPPPSKDNPKPSPSFKSHFLLGPDHVDLKRVAAKIEEIGAAHQWKGGLTWAQVKEQIKGKDANCLHRGDVSNPGAPEYAGLFFISASNKRRFTIVDADRSPLQASDNRPYSGCYVNAIIDIWAQDNQWGRRINATLTGVQFVRDGEAFGGGAAPAAAEEFGVVAGSADEATPTASADPLAGLV